MNNINITKLADLIGINVDIVSVGREGIGSEYIDSMTITGEKKTESGTNIAVHINKFDWGKINPRIHGVFIYEIPPAKDNEPGLVRKIRMPQPQQDQITALSKDLGLEVYSAISGDCAHKLIAELSNAIEHAEEKRSLEVSDILFEPQRSNFVRVSISSLNDKIQHSHESFLVAYIDHKTFEVEVMDFLNSEANYDKTSLSAYCKQHGLRYDKLKEAFVDIAKSAS